MTRPNRRRMLVHVDELRDDDRVLSTPDLAPMVDVLRIVPNELSCPVHCWACAGEIDLREGTICTSCGYDYQRALDVLNRPITVTPAREDEH